jgi:uncharacterized membrane protein
MFPFPKQKDFLTKEEAARIVAAIRTAEKKTSGEIRVFIESRCRFVDPIDRAMEVFYQLEMDETKEHNAVILYLAVKDRQLALFGDKGIHERLGTSYWQSMVKKMIAAFGGKQYAAGIENCVSEIGATLVAEFPYHNEDKNELPDDIIFGK